MPFWKCHNLPQSSKLCKLGVFWNPQDLLSMMGSDIFDIDKSWAEKLMKTRVSFLAAPTVITESTFHTSPIVQDLSSTSPTECGTAKPRIPTFQKSRVIPS